MGREIKRDREKTRGKGRTTMEGKRNGVFRTKRNGQQRGCTRRLKRVVKVREGRGER